MIKYNFESEIPTLKCLECGNTKNFDVIFKESSIEVQYRNAKVPLVDDWIDTGRDFEATCTDCSSQDIIVDESFFGY